MIAYCRFQIFLHSGAQNSELNHFFSYTLTLHQKTTLFIFYALSSCFHYQCSYNKSANKNKECNR